MSLIKWNNPSKRGFEKSSLIPMENFIDRFFNEGLFSNDYANYVPSVNVEETEGAYNIEVSAPGFEKNDFDVKIEDGTLIISGEHKSENKQEDKNFLRKEFSYGSFSRSFNLSDSVNQENIHAKYDNGILKLELPKNEKAKAKNRRQIKIA